MKKLLPIALAAAACTISAPAMAAVTIDSSSLEKVTGPVVDGDTTTITYDDADLSSPTFTEFLTFVNDVAGIYDLSVTTSSQDVDFTSITLSDDMGGVYALTQLANSGSLEFWGIDNLALDAGTFTLTLNGNNAMSGGLGGTISISPAVPEPATWMMLLLGFFGTGLALRRGKDVKQKVAFSF